MEMIIEKGFELLKIEPGSGMINSILLLMIWLNVKSLKTLLLKMYSDHEVRITALENFKNGIKAIPQLKPTEGK